MVRFFLSDIKPSMRYTTSKGFSHNLGSEIVDLLLMSIDIKFINEENDLELWLGNFEFEVTEDMGDIRIFYKGTMIREYSYPMNYVKCFYEESNYKLDGNSVARLKEMITYLLKEKNNDALF